MWEGVRLAISGRHRLARWDWVREATCDQNATHVPGVHRHLPQPHPLPPTRLLSLIAVERVVSNGSWQDEGVRDSFRVDAPFCTAVVTDLDAAKCRTWGCGSRWGEECSLISW